MSLKRYEIVIIGMIFGIMTLLIFNDKISDLLTLTNESEIKVLIYTMWLVLCIVIGFMIPIGLATEDSNAN